MWGILLWIVRIGLRRGNLVTDKMNLITEKNLHIIKKNPLRRRNLNMGKGSSMAWRG